jgi:hypothetical protein
MSLPTQSWETDRLKARLERELQEALLEYFGVKKTRKCRMMTI